VQFPKDGAKSIRLYKVDLRDAADGAALLLNRPARERPRGLRWLRAGTPSGLTRSPATTCSARSPPCWDGPSNRSRNWPCWCSMKASPGLTERRSRITTRLSLTCSQPRNWPRRSPSSRASSPRQAMHRRRGIQYQRRGRHCRRNPARTGRIAQGHRDPPRVSNGDHDLDDAPAAFRTHFIHTVLQCSQPTQQWLGQ
jgi:hypothetical protein